MSSPLTKKLIEIPRVNCDMSVVIQNHRGARIEVVPQKLNRFRYESKVVMGKADFFASYLIQ